MYGNAQFALPFKQTMRTWIALAGNPYESIPGSPVQWSCLVALTLWVALSSSPKPNPVGCTGRVEFLPNVAEYYTPEGGSLVERHRSILQHKMWYCEGQRCFFSNCDLKLKGLVCAFREHGRVSGAWAHAQPIQMLSIRAHGRGTAAHSVG